VRWLHIGVKDLTITVRDASALGILLLMPAVLIFVLGSALGNLAANLDKTPLGIVNLDRGDVGSRVTDAFFTDAELSRLFLASRYRTAADARAAVSRGDLAGALVVPADFSRRLDTGKRSELLLYTDPGRAVAGTIIRSVTDAVSTQVSAASIAARTSAFYVSSVPVSDPSFVGRVIGRAVQSATETGALTAVGLEETTATRGKEIDNLSYYAVGMSAMFILFGSMFGAFALIRERDEWTLARVMMTPATRVDIIGGKMLGVFIVGLAQFAVLYAFTTVIGVKWGDPMAVGLVAVPTVAAATGMSVLIAAVAKTVRAVSGIAQIIIQFMAAVGGSFLPVAAFPAWLQPLHYASVNGWAIDGFLEAMRGGSALVVLPHAGVLMAMGLAFGAFGAWRLRWE
jgi:ABC-2 type transport system permease protein